MTKACGALRFTLEAFDKVEVCSVSINLNYNTRIIYKDEKVKGIPGHYLVNLATLSR